MKEQTSDGNVRPLVTEILQYLVEHPEAIDTVEGVLQWWLESRRVPRAKDLVQEALDLLVADGRLTKRAISNSEEVYGANKARMEEIRALVRKSCK